MALIANFQLPKQPLGIICGPPDTPLEIEVFIDPLCPDCTETLRQITVLLMNCAGKVHFRIYFLPLPYHTWSYAAVKAIITAERLKAEAGMRALNFFLFSMQNDYTNDKTASITAVDVVTQMINTISRTLGIDTEEFQEMFDSTEINTAARTEFKHAASRGVCGTPSFFLRGAKIEPFGLVDVNDWTSLINSIIEEERE